MSNWGKPFQSLVPAKILRMADQGASMQQIAKHFGISRERARQVVASMRRKRGNDG